MGRIRTRNLRHKRLFVSARAKGKSHRERFGMHPGRLWTYHRLQAIHAWRAGRGLPIRPHPRPTGKRPRNWKPHGA